MSLLSRGPREVRVGEQHTVTVRFTPAAGWIEAITDTLGPGGILLKLVSPATADFLMDELALGEITDQELFKGGYDLLEECTRRKWWASARLILAGDVPSVLGRATAAGMDPWTLTIGQWCAGLYYLMTENADDTGRFKFDAQLDTPPAGVEDDEELYDEESFNAMVSAARNTPGFG